MGKFDILNMVSQNNQIKFIPLNMLVPYHNHNFKLYSGERFEDMVESIRQNGVLNPILVQPIDNGTKYEILSGHNRVECARKVGLDSIQAVIKENLSEEEAEMYVIETNLMQRGFNDLLISEQATVLKIRHSKMFSQGKRNDIIREIQRLEGKTSIIDTPNQKLNTRDTIASDYGLGTTSVSRLLRVNFLIDEFKSMLDSGLISLRASVELSYLTEDVQRMVLNISNENKKKLDMKLTKSIRKLFDSTNEIPFETLENFIIGNKCNKENKYVKVSLDKEVYSKYFNRNTSEVEISNTIKEALYLYFNKQ